MISNYNYNDLVLLKILVQLFIPAGQFGQTLIV